jgi:type II secretory pathway pseudopilin PulG
MNTERGFTLIEALVGLAFVSVMTAGLASLMVISTGLIRDAREDTGASALAIQKIEQLRHSIGAGAAVPVSPVTSLDTDVPGFADHPDGNVRRWRVSSPPSGVGAARVVQVRVVTARRLGDLAGDSSSAARRPGEVILTTVAAPR